MPDQSNPPDGAQVTPLITPTVWDEDRLTELFLQHNRQNFRYVPARSKWLFWDNWRWIEDDTLMIREAVKPICRAVRDTLRTKTDRERMGRTALVSNIVKAAESAIASSPDQFDKDPWLLNTPDCVIDLRTGQSRPHSRQDYMTRSTSTSPVSERPEKWLAFLAKVTNNDQALIEYLQRCCGYALTGVTSEHKFWVLHGGGGNGKGTFLAVLEKIMGDYFVSSPIETFIETSHDRHETELARFAGARLVTSGEAKTGQRWNDARLKRLTGGDSIDARFMRADYFTFKPQFKLWFAVNKRPSFRSVDNAIRRRTNMIPFLYMITKEERLDDYDLYLIEHEGPAILNWMIEGCVAWQSSKLDVRPSCVEIATDEYLSNENVLKTWVIDRCLAGTNGKDADLFTDYRAWTTFHNEFTMRHKDWVNEMQDLGHQRQRMNVGEVFLNLVLNPLRPDLRPPSVF